MIVLVVHNSYAKPSGEETAVANTVQLLSSSGHRVVVYTKSSQDISSIPMGRVRAFFSGIYSFKARREFAGLLLRARPDIVHVHNLFPLISPSILPICQQMNIPVVMTVHNYRLACPNGLFMSKRDRRPCERCLGGREYWCLLMNCEASWCKSIGYAIRNYVARKKRLFLDNVSMYACLTAFQKDKLIAAGFREKVLAVLGNMVRPPLAAQDKIGKYVAFAGRVSPEKGIDVLIAAARMCPGIEFRIAGGYNAMPRIIEAAPENCRFLGHLGQSQLSEFYASSRMVVIPSLWYEPFSICAAEAQVHARPVICSRIGGLTEVVKDGITGLLFDAGSASDLAAKLQYLWQRPQLCMTMGRAARRWIETQYSPEAYYNRLMSIYAMAMEAGSCHRERAFHVVEKEYA